MKKTLHIALTDTKIMVKDKFYFFWTLVFPMFFIIIFGNLYKYDQNSVISDLSVINRDKGKWGAYFIEKIKSSDIELKLFESEPEEFKRILIIPEDFSERIKDKKTQNLIFKKKAGAHVKAAARVEIKIIQAIAKVITELILHPDTETFFEKKLTFKNIVEIKTRFPEGSPEKIPSGFDHVIPGTLVQFIIMMVLIYGGITVLIDRQKGILSRILFSSISKGSLWCSKFLGRLFMAIIQALILIIAGKLFFNLNLGNNLLAAIVILFFCISIASLSIFVGSVLNKEDLIIGVSVLFANIFAALGGCWWPIEVVPETFKTIGMISPAYWAMDAFHKIIFFNKGIDDIIINLIIFTGYTIIFTYLSIKFFRFRDND